MNRLTSKTGFERETRSAREEAMPQIAYEDMQSLPPRTHLVPYPRRPVEKVGRQAFR